jgi:DNA invertase Pin-like site-specific DNA recombinase
MTKCKKGDRSPVRLVGYARVSTEEQARDGVSMEAQRERLKAYCLAHGARLVRVEKDNSTSGKVHPTKRPGMDRALKAIHSGRADGIVALKLDRLSRSTRDILDLADDANRHGWRLVSVSESLDTGTPAGRFTLTILAALAQLEREQTAERTRVALAHVARQGRARSRFVPFGWRTAAGGVEQQKGDRQALIPNRAEQRVLNRIQALRARGGGARTIARTLNADRVKNPRNPSKPWTHSNVGTLLRTMERRAQALDEGA